MTGMLVCCLLIAFSVAPSLLVISSATEVYDVVVLNGRVIDPESKLDAVRNIGISRGTIKLITGHQLQGRTVIDARGLVVSPAKYSEGIKFVLVNGVVVVNDGRLQSGVYPGRPVRAPF